MSATPTFIITSFSGKYKFLSNFHPCTIEYEGLEYPSLEHAYQASKVSGSWRAVIKNAPSAADAKKIGRSLNLRTDFDRINIMRLLLWVKFNNNPELKEKLLETKHAWIVEGNNHHDNFFGACHCDRCENEPKHNHLGKLLMEVRERLWCEKSPSV